MIMIVPEKHALKSPVRILILWNHVQEEDPEEASSGADGAMPSPEDDAPRGGPDEEVGDTAPEPLGVREERAGKHNQAMAMAAPLADDDEAAGAPRADHSSAIGARDLDIDALADCLRQRAYEVHTVDIEDDCERIKDAVTVIQPALVVNLVEQVYGDFIHHAAIAGYLDLLDVPYMGSELLCLATCQERVRTHIVLRDAGVAVPGFAVIRDINVIPETSALRFPVVLTQAYDDCYEQEGWDHPIHDRDQLIARSAALFKDYDPPFLIEEFVCQRSLHAVVLGNRVLEILPLVEVDDNGAWQLAIMDYDTLDRVHDMARRAFRALGCRDVARVDIHLAEDGQPYVIDVRPMLELAGESAFWAAAGMAARAREDVLADIIEAARERAYPPGDGEISDEGEQGEDE